MKKLIALFVALLFFAAGLPSVQALNTTGRVVRVAYPVQLGLTDFDEYGNYSGYTYEYLEEIAQYTGWDYEFVEVDGDINESLITLMDMVENGQVDLMGAMVYSDELGEIYDYSSLSYGVGETVLQVPYDAAQTPVINSQVSQNFRIAVSNLEGQRIRELEDYCRINLVVPEYVLCPTVKEQIQAVRDGRADMLLNTNFNYAGDLKTIARFAQKPFYFITAKGHDISLMADLNEAMMNIEQADPYFSTTLYEKYFAPKNNTLYLSDEERKYIEEAPSLKVGVLKDEPPYQYFDEETDSLVGISVDMLHYISEETGLKFELIPVDNEKQAYDMISRNEIDLVAGVYYDYSTAREHGLSMSRPYISSQYILLKNENANDESMQEKRLAIPNTGLYQGEFLGRVTYYDSVDECIRAVEQGTEDYTYVDAYTAQYYNNLPEFNNLKMIPQTSEPRKVSFGIVKPGRLELLSILNKAITTISDVDMQGIINQNAIRQQPYSFSYFLREYPLESFSIIVGVFLIIIAGLLAIVLQRAKASRQTSLELRKHYQVYALVNEYFFEYDYRKNTLLVSCPPEGKSEPEFLRYDYSKPIADEEARNQRKVFFEIITSQKSGIQDVYIQCADGEYHWLHIALETVYDGSQPAYVLGRINVIDDEKQKQENLLLKAQLDSLTHIYNAETTSVRIRNCLLELKEGQHGAFLMIDIDHFKAINDTYGHMEGDIALCELAALLKENTSEEDTVGRPGGDEFLVYLKNVSNRETLEQKCESICKKARELQLSSGGNITVSIGASLTSRDDDYTRLYQEVDRTLYKSKELGRDRYLVADSRDVE